jgi:hypothetical protein
MPDLDRPFRATYFLCITRRYIMAELYKDDRE